MNLVERLAQRLRQFGRLDCGRILGTRAHTDGDYLALLSLLERSFFLRAEATAIVQVLIKKGLLNERDFQNAVAHEMNLLLVELHKEWPEIEVTDDGIKIKDVQAFAARSKRERWPE